MSLIDNSAIVPTTDAAPAATTRENASGRSHMSTFAATLVSNRSLTVTRNGRNHPLHHHALNAQAVLTMFVNIILPLVLLNYRLLGVQTPTNAADVAQLNSIAASVAYDALVAMYAVLYHKASRTSAGLQVLFGQNPLITTNDFPIFITALINSIGPVQFNDVPAIGQHVPYLTWSSVAACLPPGYASFRVAAFMESVARSKMFAISSVDIYTSASSAWWTLHCYTERFRGNDITYSLWSPLPFEDVDNALKLAVLFAHQYITMDIGVINFSSSPYYDLNDPPRLNQIPNQAYEYPYYVESQPAYFRVLDRSPPLETATADPSYTPQSPSTNVRNVTTGSIPGASTDPRPGSEGPSTRSKKRKLPDGAATEVDHDTVLHRVVYHYFDHQVTSNVNDRLLSQWALALNKI